MMYISRNLVEFQGGEKDCYEQISDFLLKPYRKAFGGCYVKLLSNKEAGCKSIRQMDTFFITKVALGALALIGSIFTLVALGCRACSSTHAQKFERMQLPVVRGLPQLHNSKGIRAEPEAAQVNNVDVHPRSSLKRSPASDDLASLALDDDESLSGQGLPIRSRSFEGLLSAPNLEARKSYSLESLPHGDGASGSGSSSSTPASAVDASVIEHDAIEVNRPKNPDLKNTAGTVSTLFNRFASLVRTAGQYLVNPFTGGSHPWMQQVQSFPLHAVEAHVDFNAVREGSSKTPLKAMVAVLLEPLSDLRNADHNSMRRMHEDFLMGLRAILKSKEFKESLALKKEGKNYDHAVDLILTICYSRFRENYMHSFCFELMVAVLNEGVKGIGQDQNPSRYKLYHDLSLKQQFEALDEALLGTLGGNRLAVNIGSASGATDISFDPHGSGNIASHWYTIEPRFFIGHEVHCLRFATPTSSGVIIPEFRGYLEALQSRQEKHLYFSLQQYTGKVSSLNQDTVRNQSIIELQTEFPENFAVVVLAQDSGFYKQKNLQPVDAKDFIEQFMGQLTDQTGQSGFYFPEQWRHNGKLDGQLTDAFVGTLERVHQDVFGGKDKLSQQERKDFIEISYAYLELVILRYYEPNSFNLTCKDGIDRAGKCNAILYALLSLIEGKDQDAERRERTAMIHSPAWIAKQQAIVGSRRERLISALERMDENRDAIISGWFNAEGSQAVMPTYIHKNDTLRIWEN